MDVIKCPISVFCGPVIRRESTRPSSVYFDLTLLPDNDSKASGSMQMHTVTFENYFTYSITVSQIVDTAGSGSTSGSGTVDQYVNVLENRVLMRDPSSESDAHLTHVLSVQEFNEFYNPNKGLRFTLYQPSPMWASFELRNVQAFAKPVVANAGRTHAAAQERAANKTVEQQAIDDFKIIIARNRKVIHNKLALGSQLEVEIKHNLKKRKSKKK